MLNDEGDEQGEKKRVKLGSVILYTTMFFGGFKIFIFFGCSRRCMSSVCIQGVSVHSEVVPLSVNIHTHRANNIMNQE